MIRSLVNDRMEYPHVLRSHKAISVYGPQILIKTSTYSIAPFFLQHTGIMSDLNQLKSERIISIKVRRDNEEADILFPLCTET